MSIVILGAGPGGLSAAYQLARAGKKVVVLEKDSEPGGALKSLRFRNFIVDYGHKELYARIPEVFRFWDDLLGDQFLPVCNRVGVLYQREIFERDPKYRGFRRGMPWKLFVRCVSQAAWGRVSRIRKPIQSRQDWNIARKGSGFSEIFNQGYHQKVTGVDWSDAYLPSTSSDPSQNAERRHPLTGTSLIADKLISGIQEAGGQILLGTTALSLSNTDGKITNILAQKHNGALFHLQPETVIAGISLELLSSTLGLQAKPNKVEASFGRKVVLVHVFLRCPPRMPHLRLEVSCPESQIGRITNYGAYDNDMVPIGLGALCIEYFTHGHATIKSRANLQKKTIRELVDLDIIDEANVIGVHISSTSHSDAATSWEDYSRDLTRMQMYDFACSFSNLYPIQRSGIDRSTHAGILAASAILTGDRQLFLQKTKPDFPTPWLS